MTTTEHPDPDPDEPSTLVRTIRFQLKLTQRELATKLGVHPRSVSNWETGTVTPAANRLDELRKLAEMWANSQALVVPEGGVRSYYVMTYTTHQPSAFLVTLRSLKRRVDSMSADLDALIAAFEQNLTATPIVEPKETTR